MFDKRRERALANDLLGGVQGGWSPSTHGFFFTWDFFYMGFFRNMVVHPYFRQGARASAITWDCFYMVSAHGHGHDDGHGHGQNRQKILIEHCSHFWDSRKLVENLVNKSSKKSDRTLFTLLGRSKNGRKSSQQIFNKF